MLRVGWRSGFAELFVFVLVGPTALTGVERRSLGSPGPGSGKVDEVELGLCLGLGLSKRLVAECLKAMSLLGKRRQRSKAKSFCS